MEKILVWIENECSVWGSLKLIILFLGINLIWFLSLTHIYSLLGISLGEQSDNGLLELPWYFIVVLILIMVLAEEVIGRLPLICSVDNRKLIYKIILLTVISVAVITIMGLGYQSIVAVSALMLVLVTAMTTLHMHKKALIMTFILSLSFGLLHVGIVHGIIFHLLLQGLGSFMLCLLFLKNGTLQGKILKPLASTTIAHTAWNCIVAALIIL